MSLSDRSNDLSRREDAAGGPAGIIAGLVHDARWQRMLSFATIGTVIADLVITALLFTGLHGLNSTQDRQDRQSVQILTNQRNIAVAQARITAAAKTKEAFDHEACVRNAANIAEFIRTDRALADYLSQIRPRTAKVTHLVDVYRGIRLTVSVCGP